MIKLMRYFRDLFLHFYVFFASIYVMLGSITMYVEGLVDLLAMSFMFTCGFIVYINKQLNMERGYKSKFRRKK